MNEIKCVKLDCLEQSSRQLCFNTHHEKNSPWMPSIHHCLSTCNPRACSYTHPDRDSSPLADADTPYRYPSANGYA